MDDGWIDAIINQLHQIQHTAGCVLQLGEHDSTFGGNPVVCAGGIAILGLVSDKHFLDEVRRKSRYIKTRLLAMPNVEDVSGWGFCLEYP